MLPLQRWGSWRQRCCIWRWWWNQSFQLQKFLQVRICLADGDTSAAWKDTLPHQCIHVVPSTQTATCIQRIYTSGRCLLPSLVRLEPSAFPEAGGACHLDSCFLKQRAKLSDGATCLTGAQQ